MKKLNKVDDDLKQKVFAIVKRVVDKQDPESLLKMGAPENEYDNASQLISEGIVSAWNSIQRTGLAYIIALIFHFEFGLWTKPLPLHGIDFDMADKILPAISKLKK